MKGVMVGLTHRRFIILFHVTCAAERVNHLTSKKNSNKNKRKPFRFVFPYFLMIFFFFFWENTTR